MTDKQKIIDGIDVSSCNHYKNNGKCRIPHYQQGIKYTCCNCNEWDCEYKQLKRKEQECEKLKRYLNEIRDEELSQLDIEWDEYETSARQEDYSNIITLVERALGEIDV